MGMMFWHRIWLMHKWKNDREKGECNVLRKLRIVSMRGYEARMMQISDDPDFPLPLRTGEYKELTSKQFAMLEEYKKLQKEYLKLVEINRKEYEDGKVDN